MTPREQKIPMGTFVMIKRPGHPWYGHSGIVSDFYPNNPFGICYGIDIGRGVKAGAKEGDLMLFLEETT